MALKICWFEKDKFPGKGTLYHPSGFWKQVVKVDNFISPGGQALAY
jgi:hypothetical protein